MKNLFIISLLCLISIISIGQTEKKKVLLSTQLNYSSKVNLTNPSIEYEEKRFQITPSFGTFLANNFAMGITASIGKLDTRQGLGGANYFKAISYGGGGFIRLYGKVNEKFSFFGHGSSTINFYSSQNSFGSNDNLIISSSIIPGFVFFVKPKIGIEAMFGRIYLDYINNENGLNTKSIRSGLDLNMSSFGLGINFYL